jgi:hypothetical protein
LFVIFVFNNPAKGNKLPMKDKMRLLFIMIVLTSFIGCVKEKFDQNKLSKSYFDDITVAVPIGYAKTSLLEIFAPQVNSGILILDADSLMRFRFSQGLINIPASNIIQFPQFDSTFTIINNTGQAINLNPAGTNVQISQSFSLDFGYSQGKNGEEIDSIQLNNMNMDINVMASGILNANLNSTFPGIKYNNLAYFKNLVVSSSNTYSDLMAYTVHLQNSGIKKNQLQVNFTLNMGQTARTIAPGEKIMDIYLRFSTIDFAALYGYIGQININPAPIINNRLELLNNKINGYFNFDHGYFDLNTKNSFGLPFAFQLNNFSCRTFYKPTNGLVFQNNNIPSEVSNIPFPTMSQIGQAIDGAEFINTGSVSLGFQDYYSLFSSDLSVKANPKGKQDYNFVRKNSQLEILTAYSLPFWGNTSKLQLNDIINLNMTDFFSSTYANITRLLFVINFTNALPMNSKIQIYFCDAAGSKLDSMFVSPCQVSGSSQADNNGKVSPEPNNPVKAEILANRLAKIEQTAYLLVKTDLKTIDVEKSPPVSWKFFSDYYFYIHIGVAATLNQ